MNEQQSFVHNNNLSECISINQLGVCYTMRIFDILTAGRNHRGRLHGRGRLSCENTRSRVANSNYGA